MKTSISIILAVLTTLLLLVVQSSYWYKHYVVDPTNFSNAFIAGTASDESKRALADQVVDRALEKRPVIKQFFGDNAKAMVYSLFGTRYFQSAIEKIAASTHTRLMSPDTPDLTINIAAVKDIALPILERLRPEAAQNLQSRDIPDAIVIVDQKSIPPVYKYTPAILWAGWMSLVAGLILAVYYFYKNVKEATLARSLKIMGGVVALVFILAMISVETLKPLLTVNVASSNLRIVADNVVDAFLTTYTKQQFWITAVGFIVFLAGFVYDYFSNRKLHLNHKKSN